MSQAEVVRCALAAYDNAAQPDRHFALTASGTGDGHSIADIPDEELFEGFGEPEHPYGSKS